MVDLYITLPPDFERLVEEYRKKVISIRSVGTEELEISYDPITGGGSINSNTFKLKDGSPEFKVFSQLYTRIGKKLDRRDVLIAIGFYDDNQDPDPARKTSETARINEAAKAIRERTGLDTKQLVQNAGNLTLVAKKSPKSAPNRPK